MPDMNRFSPNQSDAPEPRRELHLPPEAVSREHVVYPSQFDEAPAPDNPQAAMQELEEGQKAGELIAALGRQREEYEAQLAELKLQMRLMQQESAAQSAPPRMPDGIDPKAFATNEQIVAALYQFGSAMQAELAATRIRARWDVTDAEEQAALATYPNINHKQEPARTEAILEAVRVLRKSKPATAPPTPGNPAYANATPAPRTVPSPAVAPTTVPDSRPAGASDSLRKAFADYEAAKRLPNKSQRVAAMKEAHERILRLQNTTRENVATGSFRM